VVKKFLFLTVVLPHFWVTCVTCVRRVPHKQRKEGYEDCLNNQKVG